MSSGGVANTLHNAPSLDWAPFARLMYWFGIRTEGADSNKSGGSGEVSGSWAGFMGVIGLWKGVKKCAGGLPNAPILGDGDL